eukprot:m.199004 g.199004  ORF g.199004 m.199004 type:complete len:525 (-) comp20636_c0_seq1:131-1705(-)
MRVPPHAYYVTLGLPLWSMSMMWHTAPVQGMAGAATLELVHGHHTIPAHHPIPNTNLNHNPPADHPNTDPKTNLNHKPLPHHPHTNPQSRHPLNNIRLPDAPPWPELQATPTMGYNGWLAAAMGNETGARNESLYYRLADELVNSGLAAAGYDTLLTVCIGWVRNPVTHKLEAPAATWPHGFKALVDYVHAKGLKIGAYTDTGAVGCCNPCEIGSYGHELLDMQQFADWDVDHVAVDNCGAPYGRDQSVREYAAIHDALVQVGKPMVYGIWNIGAGKPQTWANKLGHYWRTGSDVGNRWGQTDSVAGSMGVMFNFDTQQAIPNIAAASGPGSFAFLDELMVGLQPGIPHGRGDTGLTPDETASHFALWCIMASPLWLTYDILHPPPNILPLVTNPEAIAINQDALGTMATRIDGAASSPSGLINRLPATCTLETLYPNGEHFARPLSNGDWGVVLLNRLTVNKTLVLHFVDIGDTTVTCFRVRDVWLRQDLGTFVSNYTASGVPSHGHRFLRLTPANQSACDMH